MRTVGQIFSVLCVLLIIAGATPLQVSAQQSTLIITAPRPGDALQGVITITGTSQVEGFTSAEIAFAYDGDPTGTWFRITTSSQPVEDGILAIWDTTSISDGVYDLRLRVLDADGKSLEVVNSSLRVRNYTPVETATPTAFVPAATPFPTHTATPTLYPTPTVLPTNPAVLSTKDVSKGIGYGGLAAILLFLVLGMYLWLRRKS
jgi:hypothetical protein